MVVSPGLELDDALAELADPELGSGQVLQDRDLAAGATGGFADAARGFRVLVGAAVGEVQACDIHPGLDHAGEDLRVARGGADRGDDLRAALHQRRTIERRPRERVADLRVMELARLRCRRSYTPDLGSAAAYGPSSREDRARDERRQQALRARRSPDKPTDIPKEAWPAILKRTFKQFGEDQLTTWAAALTYFGILSLFPMLLAMVSVLGVIGPSATQPLLDNLSSVAPGPAKDILTNVLTSLESNQGGSTVALLIGLAAAIWAASGYIGAFMDASNNVWDAPEGRPIWKKIPVRLGDHRRPAHPADGDRAGRRLHRPGGAGDRRHHRPRRHVRRASWGIAKWPILLLIVSFMISLLYWACPNVKQPGFPWVTPGGLLAVVLWIAASALFALYVANFSSYNKTYG